jgi:hypothetical protein
MAVFTETITTTKATSSFVLSGNFSMSIKGNTASTVAFQRSLDGGATWGDAVSLVNSNGEYRDFEAIGGILFRFNVTRGGSDSIVVQAVDRT